MTWIWLMWMSPAAAASNDADATRDEAATSGSRQERREAMNILGVDQRLWRLQRAKSASDNDGGGEVVPQRDGVGPITRSSVPPLAIWPWRNHAASSG